MSGKSRLRMSPFQDGELLLKRQVCQEEVTARTARPNDQIEKKLQRAEHGLVVEEASMAAKQNPSHDICPWLLGRQHRLWQVRQCELNLLRRFATNSCSAKTRSICALFIGFRLLCIVLGVIR
jgi:hypothetical protein